MVKYGSAVTFATSEGKDVINYGGLVAKDATGRELGSLISPSVGRITLQIDIRGAEYPVTIDPVITGLSTTADWTAESNQASAGFGRSVATAGDVNGDGYSDVIVGAHYYDGGQTDEGAAFVYYGSATGLSATADWSVQSNQAEARMGVSVGTAGDVNGDGYSDVIVGAYLWDDGQTDEGAALVYHGSASGLSTTADWSAKSNQALAYFGYSVATAGDVNGDGYSDVIVGAYYYDGGQTDEGAAYVYHGSASGLSAGHDWTAESNQAVAHFGCSVATAGDVNGDGYIDVIVGADGYTNGESDEGRAFVYYGSPGGLSTVADWTGESDQASAAFGCAVSTAGDINGDGYADVIVGANAYDVRAANEGAAFVYHGSGAGLSTSADRILECNQGEAKYGHSVATAGDVNGDGYADVIVGAHNYDNGQTDEGMAFVYHGSAAGLDTFIFYDWGAQSDQADAHLGVSVGTAGDVNGDGYSDVIVGADGYTNGQSYEGRAFVYHGSPAGPSYNADWTAESNQASAYFGYSVATAGDVNGDGYADVIVGADGYDNGQTNEGAAFVYHGSANGLSVAADWTAESNQASAAFGRSVATAGDVNGDGYDDIIVGAYKFDNGETNEGGIFVYHGSATGLSTVYGTAEGNQVNAYFGYSVATAGDVNGDGYADVIIGADSYNNGESYEGAAFVYHGSAAGLTGFIPCQLPTISSDWMAEGDQENAYFGRSVSTAGDVNGDGFADVIVGAGRYTNGQSYEGAAFVYHGSASGLSTTADWTAEGNQNGAFFGDSVGTAGDVNGDGYADVIVGAYHYENGDAQEGAAFVYHGSANGLSVAANWTAESDQYWAHFGCSVGTAGDVNGDGYTDVIVGVRDYDNPQIQEGAAFVYYGSVTGLSPSAGWVVDSDQDGANFGQSVATAGDVNGDGYSDVIVGAYLYDNGQSSEGRAFVFYGNEGGLSLNPRQRHAPDTGPVAHLGMPNSSVSFRLALLGRTPFGRAKVKLEWEVKLLGELFDGSGTGQSDTWTDTGTVGVELNELVSGLSGTTVYHWRVRLLYHPATTPLQQYSRWVTMPWNGWQEADFRTSKLNADLTGDGCVNMLDLALLMNAWLVCE
jgi:hypothetical protein